MLIKIKDVVPFDLPQYCYPWAAVVTYVDAKMHYDFEKGLFKGSSKGGVLFVEAKIGDFIVYGQDNTYVRAFSEKEFGKIVGQDRIHLLRHENVLAKLRQTMFKEKPWLREKNKRREYV